MEYILIYFLFLLYKIETKNLLFEKSLNETIKIYDKMNIYETVKEAQIFIINTTQKSYAYFDSNDNNAHF